MKVKNYLASRNLEGAEALLAGRLLLSGLEPEQVDIELLNKFGMTVISSDELIDVHKSIETWVTSARELRAKCPDDPEALVVVQHAERTAAGIKIALGRMRSRVSKEG